MTAFEFICLFITIYTIAFFNGKRHGVSVERTRMHEKMKTSAGRRMYQDVYAKYTQQ